MDKKNLTKSLALWQRAKKLIPGGTQLLSKRAEMFLPEGWPAYYDKAKGSEIWDLDGNKYLDMSYMAIGACVLGYADDDVDSAVQNVIKKGSMATLNSPEEVELAEMLLKIHPWAEMVRYARCGGEAMAAAVRIARAYSGKDEIAFCGYHGWHDWYLSSNLADDKNLDGHLLPGLEPAGVPRGLKGTALPFNYNKIEELEAIVKNNPNIGTIVLEPFRTQEPENDFLAKVRKIADKIGAVLIFDEVSSGWRFGVGGIHLEYGINPDIVVFAKAMSNGYPMAAIIGKGNVMNAAQETFISSTYWTERIGPAAALAAIRKMVAKKVPESLKKTGGIIIEGLNDLAKTNGIKLTVSGAPALIHLSFGYGNDSQAVRTLFTQEMLKRGILATAAVYVSYSHTPDNVQKYLAAVDETFALLKRAVDENKIGKLLDGPIAHEGFKRLT